MTDYTIWLSDPFGQQLTVIPLESIGQITYSLVANAVGALTLTVPRAALPDTLIVRDAILDVWRSPTPGTRFREGGTSWLVITDTRGYSSRDGWYRRIKAVSANHLLSRRYVLYYAGSGAGAGISSTPADDAMKDIVTRNLGSSADSSPLVISTAVPTRRIDSYLTVAGNASAGPSISKDYAWRNVLTTLQEIARDAANAGTPIYFDVTATATGFAFQTWANVRGVDRTSGVQLFTVSAERGSLGGTIESTTDWTDAASVVVAGGQGQNSARALGASYSPTRIAASRFGEREFFLEATQLSSTTSLAAEAQAELQDRRPAKVLTGTIQSVAGAVYGVDWGFGDRIKVEFDGDVYTARVDNLTVTVDKGTETIAAAIQGES